MNFDPKHSALAGMGGAVMATFLQLAAVYALFAPTGFGLG